jgi:hypothetical protein
MQIRFRRDGRPVPQSTRRGNSPPARCDVRLQTAALLVPDVFATVLSDAGGVEVVRTDQIRSRVSCPSLTDLPGDSAMLFGLPLRESLLKALAREHRPTTPEDPRCVVRVDTPSGAAVGADDP